MVIHDAFPKVDYLTIDHIVVDVNVDTSGILRIHKAPPVFARGQRWRVNIIAVYLDMLGAEFVTSVSIYMTARGERGEMWQTMSTNSCSEPDERRDIEPNDGLNEVHQQLLAQIYGL